MKTTRTAPADSRDATEQPERFSNPTRSNDSPSTRAIVLAIALFVYFITGYIFVLGLEFGLAGTAGWSSGQRLGYAAMFLGPLVGCMLVTLVLWFRNRYVLALVVALLPFPILFLIWKPVVSLLNH